MFHVNFLFIAALVALCVVCFGLGWLTCDRTDRELQEALQKEIDRLENENLNLRTTQLMDWPEAVTWPVPPVDEHIASISKTNNVEHMVLKGGSGYRLRKE